MDAAAGRAGVQVAGTTTSGLLEDLDPGIGGYVRALRDAGVETYESCEGGPGHALPDPTVRFHGERAAGWHALAAAQAIGMPVLELRWTWPINDGEPSGPYWELVFRARAAASCASRLEPCAVSAERVAPGP